MKRLLVAIICASLFVAVAAQPAPAIVGGTVADIRDAPYNAALLWKEVNNPYAAFWCGGTIVARDWVLTAAHCVTGIDPPHVYRPDAFEVGVGRTDLHAITPSDRRAVTAIIVHPQWKYANEYDVALMHLSSPVPQEWVLPINRAAAVPGPGQTSRVYGWGLPAYSGNFLARLHSATMPVTACGSPLPAGYICAGGLVHGEVHNTCNGDSGGPLVADGKLIGVTSRGFGSCTGRRSSSGFIRVSAVADWIGATAHI